MARNKNFNEDEVLEKALKLFWKQGYSNTSPEDIVSTLGISRSSLYNTYGDKRKLFLTSLKKYINTRSKLMINGLESSNNVKNAISDLFNSVIEQDELYNQYGCFLINTSIEFFGQDDEIQNILMKNKIEIIQALRELVNRSQLNGSISNKENPEKLAFFIYNNLIGLRVNVRNGANHKELINIIEITSSILY